MWLLGVLQKSFPKKFIKKYLCYSLFRMLLKSFRLSGLQLYWRDTLALVFQNQPFVDLPQNRCSWIIHKTHRKTLLCWSYFFKNTFFYRTSPVAALESFRFPACNFIIKATTAKMFFSEFSKFLRTSFLLTEHLRMTASCAYLWIWVFQNTSFIQQLRKTAISCTSWRILTTR